MKSLTIMILALVALTLSGCGILPDVLDAANPIETTTTFVQATDPVSGEKLFDEAGEPILDKITQTELKPQIRNVVSSFGPWGELAVALSGTLLTFFTIKKTREASKSKEALAVTIKSIDRAGVADKVKAETKAAIPSSRDPIRGVIRDAAAKVAA